MKIAIVTDSIERGPKSISNYTYNFIKNLIALPEAQNYKFYLIHSKKNKLDIYENKNVIDIIIPNLKGNEYIVKKINWRFQPAILMIQNNIKNYYRTDKVIKFLRDQNVNILHIPHLGRNAPSLKFLRCNKLKLIVTNHGMANLLLPDNICWGNVPLFIKDLYKLEAVFWKILSKRINHIITVSNSEKKYVIEKKLKFPTDKISVIYHGVNHDIFKPYDKEKATTILSNKYNISFNFPFILHVSNFQPKKNLIRILKAFRNLKHKFNIKHKLVICGPQPYFIKEKINELECKDDILLLGNINFKYLPFFYSLASCFVFPSLHESFGMPIVEAMACGCPVITSNIFSCPEVAKDAALLVNPYDIEEIAAAVYKVISNVKVRECLREKSLIRAKEFTWEKCAKEHLSLYLRV